jgi:cytochrome P450
MAVLTPPAGHTGGAGLRATPPTGTSTISRLLWLLPQHPALLARLRAEQQAAVAQHGTAITEAVLRECTYLDAVVREVLRLYVSGTSCQYN